MHIYLLSELGLNPGRLITKLVFYTVWIYYFLQIDSSRLNVLFVKREIYLFYGIFMKVKYKKYIQQIANAQKYLFSCLIQ